MKLYLCKSCGFIFNKPKDEGDECPKCKQKGTRVSVEYEERDSSAGKFNTPLETYLDEVGSKEHGSERSGWIEGLKIVGWMIFVAFILVGIVLVPFMSRIHPLAGIITLFACFCVGFMSVAMTMVFLDMAQDVRTIRSRMCK